MRIVFFGTSLFAAKILEHLFRENLPIVAVVTRPDRPFGRSLKVSAPVVKQTVQKLKPDLPLLQPEKASTPQFAEELKKLDADLFVVVAYGEILKQNILDLPRSGAINVHASLLPKYRGAAPMQRCLMDGCKETGVTIMNMVLEMDAGDMLKTVTLPIPEEMTRGELEERLWELSAPALVQVIQEIENGSVKKTAQNPAQVTFAPKIKPEEEEIHWSAPATKIHNQIRGLSPAPGAWCFTKVGEEKKRLKIKRSKVVREMSGKPGQILVQDKKQLIVACGENALSLIEVQLEGKKSLPIGDFLRGLQETLHFV